MKIKAILAALFALAALGTSANSEQVTSSAVPYLGPFGVVPSSAAASPIAAGTGYVPGELITLTGGAFTRAAVMAVMTTQVVSATVAAGGSGGTNGTQTVTGTTGTGTKFQASVTVSGNAITAVLSITVAGSYSVNPTDITQEPVTGASLTGAKLNVTMGVLQNQVVDPGLYSVTPSNPVGQGSTSGSGTGANFTLSFGPWASGILGNNLAGGGNLFIGGNSSSANELAGGQNYGAENTFIGDRAGAKATSGSFNTAVGHNAYGIGAGVAVTGNNNTDIGTDAMRNQPGGSGNTAVGSGALKTAAFASNFNTAIGGNAVGNWSANQSSANNTAIGYGALQGSVGTSTFLRSTAIGKDAGLALTTGNDDTFVGQSAGSLVTQGSRNVIIGSAVATTTLTTGSDNVLIGTSSSIDTAASNTANTIQIGAGSTCVICVTGTGTPSTSVTTISGVLINAGITSDATHTDAAVCEDTTSHQFYAGSGAAGICLGTSSLRYKDNVLPLQPGLSEILRLGTISYNYKPGYGDPSRRLYGFVAEQVNTVMPELVGLNRGGQPNSVDWAGVVPVLVHAIQEQQREIEELESRLKTGQQ